MHADSVSFCPALHIGQAIKTRLWWLLGTVVLCGIGEVIGWGGRLWSSLKPGTHDAFLMQITTTIIAPTFLLAVSFVTLARIIRVVGPQYSRLSPAAYSYIFITADVAALLVQAVGGSQASAAETLEDANKGGKVMLGGIALQFAALVIYVIVAAEFLLRVIQDRPVRPVPPGYAERREKLDRKVKLMILGLAISAVFIFIRTVYRTIELNDGWNGKIITKQSLFNWLDGMPICVAMFTLNFLHPGWLVFNKDRVLPGTPADAEKLANASQQSTMPTM
ncbi:RTA1-domain-containing protein [Auriculariales sp. MPI-PUGE-AT-0066]|nr:RTA1-domain-containing protein [Auriculariales sp. MPI-PUGE-AT-0066]